MPDQKPWERYGSPQTAPSGMPPGAVMIAPANPYDMPKDAASLDSTRAGTRRIETLLPVDLRKAELDAENTRLTNEKLKYDLAHPTKADTSGDSRLGTLRALETQIGRVRELYKAGPGSTKGIAGLSDYLGTPGNSQFDTAGAALGEIGNAAFKVPGQGSQSDADAARFVAANVPRASDYDTAIEEKIRALETRLQSTYQQLGVTPGAAPASGRKSPQEDARAILGAVPPNGTGGGPAAPGGTGGVNYSTPVMGGGPSGSNMLATGAMRNEVDPEATALVTSMVNAGKSPAEINATLQKMRPGIGLLNDADITAVQKYRKAHPDYNGVEPITRNIAMSGYEQFRNNAAQSPLGTFAINAGNAVTGDNLDSIAGMAGADPAKIRMGIDSVSAQNPKAAFGGNLVGGALAAGGLEALAPAGAGLWGARGADAAYGAIAGAGGADDGNRLTGAIGGGVAGVGGGMFGRGVMRNLGRASTGVRDESVRYLRDAGVPLTVGQALGNSGRIGQAAKGIEDRLTGIPLVGDMVNARRTEGFEGFNRAAFDEGLAPINRTTGGMIREQGVDVAQDAVSDAFGEALDNVNLQPDAPFGGDFQMAQRAAASLPPEMAENARYTLQRRVADNFQPTGLTGNDFQQSMRGLQQDASSLRNAPYGNDFGNVTRQAGGALEGLLERQAPDALPAYNQARGAYRGTEILRDAVNRGRNGTRVGDPGLFAPSQLADAAASNSKRFGNSQGTTRQPFFDLTRAGQRVLPSAIPDSGTAGRLAVTGGVAALGGGGAGLGYLGGDPETGAGGALSAGALLALAGTRSGQRTLTRLILDRPDVAVRIGGQLNGRLGRTAGGMFGASLGAGLSPALLPQ